MARQRQRRLLRRGDAEHRRTRGIQLTDDTGAASFTTIYPGWYTGRAVHIHFKVRSSNDATEAYEFTSQLFFDDDRADRVYARAPYVDR
ncbi:hypothetical protein [Haloferax chudinovii]|uniref:Dioxygenase n=1 Tax=Haloferax chudinovii TaxID=1109010 RepID=A0ABD5XNF8_9EURY